MRNEYLKAKKSNWNSNYEKREAEEEEKEEFEAAVEKKCQV